MLVTFVEREQPELEHDKWRKVAARLRERVLEERSRSRAVAASERQLAEALVCPGDEHLQAGGAGEVDGLLRQ